MHLVSTQSDIAIEFWNLVQATDDFGVTVAGPAKVLAYACSKLGWIVCPHYVVMVSPGVRISLLYTDKGRTEIPCDESLGQSIAGASYS